MSVDGQRLYIVDCLKAFACLMIINFHSDILFPDQINLLAFGGDIGNNIFFMVSGFTLYHSIKRNEMCQIGFWYQKRLKRLLPMLILFYVPSIVIRDVNISKWMDIVTFFIFPTIYWFTGAILLFYPLLFTVEKMCSSQLRRLGCVILLILHILSDGIIAERYFIGFIAMLIGYSLREYLENEDISLIRISRSFYYSMPLAWMLYLILKLLRKKGVRAFGVIHLGIGLTTITIAALFLIWGYINDGKIKRFFVKRQEIRYVIQTLSQVTLAAYLAGGFHDRMIMRIIQRYMSFPISYLVSLTTVILFALAISKIDRFIQRLLVEV